MEICCRIFHKADGMLKDKTYEESLDWAGKILEQYPNCEKLIWQIALVFDVGRMMGNVSDSEKYDDTICAWYGRALESKDETIRQGAADSLFYFYMRKKEYGKPCSLVRMISTAFAVHCFMSI